MGSFTRELVHARLDPNVNGHFEFDLNGKLASKERAVVAVV
jgi:hypothetical protein